MSLMNRCSGYFPSQMRERGRFYYDRRLIYNCQKSQFTFSANIENSDGDTIEVLVRWSTEEPEALFARCSCEMGRQLKPCKHLWATLLMADKHGFGAGIPSSGPLRLDFTTSTTSSGATQAKAGAGRAEQAAASANVAGARTAAPARTATAAAAQRTAAAPSTPAALGTAGTAAVPRGTSSPSGTKRVPPTISAPTDTRKDEASYAWKAQLECVRASFEMQAARASAIMPPRISKTPETYFLLDWAVSRKRRLATVAFAVRNEIQRGADAVTYMFRATTFDPNRLPQDLPEGDRELIELLLGGANGDVSQHFGMRSQHAASWIDASVPAGTISRPLYDIVFPKLCATKRFLVANFAEKQAGGLGGAQEAQWEAGPPWQIQQSLARDGMRQQWRLESRLKRGQESKTLLGAYLLESCGLALIGNSLTRLDAGSASTWVGVLQGAPLRIPFDDGPAFLEMLSTFPEWPHFDLPDELNYERVISPPVLRLTVRPDTRIRTRKRLFVTVGFRYGDQEVPAGDRRIAVPDSANRKIYERDREFERKAWDVLSNLDLLREDHLRMPEFTVHFVCDLKQLGALTDWTIKAKCELLAEGKLLRSGGQTRLSVQSGVDWFDLDGVVEFGDASAKLPDVLAAVRRGERHVLLDDGTHGMLPDEWIDRFGHLIGLGEKEGDSIRFKPSQGLLLDSLLASQPAERVSFDAGFGAWRERLRGFRGVAPQSAPASFQGTLRAYQELGLGWLKTLADLQLGGCLADDMGLGKTIQVLARLETRRQEQMAAGAPRRTSLVVMPKSLIFNWMDEASRFTPDLRVLNLTGQDREASREVLGDHDVVITTYGTLRRDIEHLASFQFDYVILDEAQAIKNASSQAAKACRLLQADHRLAMTGTPIENHLGELWSLFEFLNPGILGGSTAFGRLVKSSRSSADGKEADGKDADDTRASRVDSRTALAQAIRPFVLRRTKSQVLTELPERTEQTLYCEMEGEQKKLYDEIRDYYRRHLADSVRARGMAKSKIQVLEALLRLRQAACHPALIDPKHADCPSVKLDVLEEQIAELIAENHKALVFSQFTSLLARVRQRFDAAGIRYEYLDGSTANRKDCVQRFQTDPNIPVFLISLKAGGHGLNLTAADYVFILDPWWNPAVEAQAIDRAYRMGQTRNVFAYRLICRDSIEDKIVELQRQKRALADAIIREDDGVLSELTAEDLERLLS